MFIELKVSTLDNIKGFIHLCFLQKINCQKTEWEQASFSSPVYQFAKSLQSTGKRVSKHGQTDIVMDIATYRLNPSRGQVLGTQTN